MSQEEFGLYGYIVAIIGTFSLVFNLGVYTAQSKLYHDYPERRGEIVFTINVILLAFIVMLLLSVLVFDLDYRVVSFLFTQDLDYSKYRYVILLAVVATVYSQMVTNFFLTSEKLSSVQLYNTLRIILINVVVLTILALTDERDRAFQRIQLTYIVEAVILSFFLVVYIRNMSPVFDQKIARRALKISLPVLCSAILGLFINLTDRYAIEKFGTLADMSVYNVALSIAGVIPFVFASFQNVWLPHFLKEKDMEINRQRSKKMVIRLVIIFGVMGAAILIGMKLLLLTNIIEDKYNSVTTILPVVLLTSAVSSLTIMYSNHLIYMDKLYIIILTGFPLAFLAVGLNFNLVPRFNVMGAAISSLIVSSCYLIVYGVIVTNFYKKTANTESNNIL